MLPTSMFRGMVTNPTNRKHKEMGKMKKIIAAVLAVLALAILGFVFLGGSDESREIGSATGNWRAFTPNDKIVVQGFQDPDIPGITIYFTRADRGGLKGMVGLAEDKSNASVAAVLTGTFAGPVPKAVIDGNGKEIFRQSQSAVFKHMMVKRFYDAEKNSVIYMAHSRQVVEGGYKSSVSAVWLGDSGKGE